MALAVSVCAVAGCSVATENPADTVGCENIKHPARCIRFHLYPNFPALKHKGLNFFVQFLNGKPGIFPKGNARFCPQGHRGAARSNAADPRG